MKNRIVQIGIFLLLALFGHSQDVEFTTSVAAKKVGLTDLFEVTYVANKPGTFFTPKYKDFEQVSSISQQERKNVNLNTGAIVVDYSFSITLKPKKIGEFIVEGAKYKVGKATYESKSVDVNVVKESQVRQRRRRAIDPFEMMDEMMRGMPQARPQQMKITDKDIFAKISVSKGKVMKSEGFLVTYKVYARNFNFGIENYDFPTQENFWTENIKISEEIKPTQETIEGIRYQVYTLKKELLFPQKSGDLKLNSFGITARIQTSPFSSPISKEIKSNSPVIKVQPLPNNPPNSFENQVGDYSMKVELGKDSFQINEPIDYKIIVSGKGNLKQLSQLEIEFPKELEVYDPEVNNKISVSESGLKGSKTFNYLLIPRKSGKFNLPELNFSYFDLESKSYKTLNFPAQEISVTNPDGAQEMAENLSSNQKIEKQNTTISLNLNYIWFGLGALGILGVVFLLFLLISKRKNREESEEDRIKNARKKLVKKLAVAKLHLDKGEVSAFYNEILVGLNKYVNEKLGIETANMTKHTIRKTLDEKGVSETTVRSFVEIIEQCEMAKYATLTNQNNQEIYGNSLNVISKIEDELN